MTEAELKKTANEVRKNIVTACIMHIPDTRADHCPQRTY